MFLKSMRREWGKQQTDRQIAMRDRDAITITNRESEFENRVESREQIDSDITKRREQENKSSRTKGPLGRQKNKINHGYENSQRHQTASNL